MKRHSVPAIRGRVALWALILLVCLPCAAQIYTGQVSGTVLDNSGAVIPSAQITMTNVQTGRVATVSTQGDGYFVVPALDGGEYLLRISKTGFNTAERKGILLQSAERLALGSFTLGLGNVVEEVSVTAEASLIKVESAERTGYVTESQLDNLLVLSRGVPSLVALLPGVVQRADTDYLSRNSGFSFSAAGGAANTNVVTVDGILSTDLDAAGLKLQVSQDAVSEVTVLLSNYRAEYASRGSGAIVNMSLKSGTRDFHGLFSYFKKHEQFNANDFFLNRQEKPKNRYRFNTYTYNVGGPVSIGGFNRSRTKLFFFWNQEFWPNKDTRSGDLTVPTLLERKGDFSQSLYQNNKLITIYDPYNNGAAFPGNKIPENRLDPNGVALLNVLPLPNFFDRSISKGAYNYHFDADRSNPNRISSLKIDYEITSNHRISGTYSAFDEIQKGMTQWTFGSNWPNTTWRFQGANKGVALHYTAILTPTIVNEARFSWFKNPETLEADPPDAILPNLRANAGFTVGQFAPTSNPKGLLPTATFGGVPSAANINITSRYPMDEPLGVHEVSDNVTLIRSTHTFKAGILVNREYRDSRSPSFYPFGNFSFGINTLNPLNTNYAYANAALGVYESYTEALKNPFMHAVSHRIDWFLQDTWKLTPRLTIDVGMRFNRIGAAYMKEDNWAAFVPKYYNPADAALLIRPGLDAQGKRIGVDPITGETYSQVAIGAFANGSKRYDGMVSPAVNDIQRGMYKNPGIQFGPRVGFALDVFGNGKTSVRGGFGAVYNQDSFVNWRNYTPQPPLVESPTLYFGEVSKLLTGQTLMFPSNVNGLEQEGLLPMVMNYSFGIQQDVGFSTALDVAYVGSVGRHLFWNRPLNNVPFGADFAPQNQDPTTGLPLPAALLRPIQGYGNISYREYAGSSNYHSMQVSVTRRFARNLSFGGNWTWSKAMEYSAPNGLVPIREWNYGPGSYDRTHTLKINWQYSAPNGPWQHPVLKGVFNNWQLSGIASFQSGAPADISLSTTTSLDITGSPTVGARPDLLGNPALPKGERTFERNFKTELVALPKIGTYGNAPTTPLRGPGLNNWDLAVFKGFPIRERAHIQIRWELYNAFNHTQFTAFDTSAKFTPAGVQTNTQLGQYTSAAAARRMQFDLRLTF